MTTTKPTGQHITVTGPTHASQNWPEADSHVWGEFPYLAVEAGGYGDLVATDPGTGRTIRVSDAADSDNPYTNLRALIDAMEREGFLDTPTG